MADEMIPQERPEPPRSWPDYRAVWRWHFYASIFCMPFVVVLSMTGAIYLFKPQVEAWIDRPYDRLEGIQSRKLPSEHVAAAVAAHPGANVTGYELPTSPNSAVRVLVRKGGETRRVYVHPETLTVMHSVAENDRFMRVMFRLHGELLMGDRGSNLVELAASWTIVMLITGLYLWWPRQQRSLAGVIYPRLNGGSRIFWRDLHAVPGFWITAFALFLLATGLPWAKFWGNYFKTVRQMTGTAVAAQDWTTGSERPSGSAGQRSSGGGEHSEHGSGRRRRETAAITDFSPFDRIAATVEPLQLAYPVVIAPPAAGTAAWSAKSNAGNRPLRVNLELDAATGDIVHREDFAQRHWVDRVVGVGIAAHEGQLFGWPNQLLGLFTAMGLMLLCVTGAVMWWRRRDSGTLGAPKPVVSPRFSYGLLMIVVMLALYIPLFGASLLVVLVVERLILVRIPPVQRWLGLYSPGAARGAA